ncbi:ATP-dependent Clp protease ATP-binding subunit [Prochlorococcus marinus]|uniref:ATP-dependent chaperone ClpB n=1 Tax=Prochlorococcus marinus XMU1408 TaxID=2213228 RepID=A0A318R259_PROMR|nr:AAA family ATPase [Prochlorococcus marinus]MBW3041268.1 ATP-dependent chaperone ClpB [Prochlorococcus marinus str. XMU1408]PYE03856.1 ATP-dependent chaperone ClpB [Prochlorococcus marinus XMU1408]
MTSLNQNSTKMNGSLTTEPDSFSDEAWNLLLIAEQSARRWRHQNLDVEHLIEVLFRNKKFQKYTNPLPINHDEISEILENFLAELPINNQTDLFVGEDLENLLETADDFRSRWGSNQIEISHILIAIGRDNRLGEDLFYQAGLPSEILEAELRRLPAPKSFQQPKRNLFKQIEEKPKKDSKPYRSTETTSNDLASEPQRPLSKEDIKSKQEPLSLSEMPSALDLYCKDLTAEAEAGKLDPVIGRESEIKAIIKVLSRRGKNNPVLIGAPGVGKTAVAELLAQKIIDNELPESLQGFKLISLDIGALIAGTKFRGQFEERFRSLLSEISNNEKGVILFIDELHTIVSKERSNTDAGSLLKPLLANGDLRCIGATTPENYRRTIEKDLALDRRFQQVLIKEPSLDLSLEILKGLKENYEFHHRVTITDQALITAIRLAHRYISDRCLPDKAIDLIDEASAQVKLESTSKPKIIEDKESQINHLDSLILNANQERSFENINKLEEEKNFLVVEIDNIKQKWQDQLDKSDELQELKLRYEELANLITEAEISGNLEEKERLKYNQFYQIKERIKEIEVSIKEDNVDGNSLIKDQVDPDDIADVVSRWTGIPVSKVLSGERQKLLNLEQDLEKKVIGQLNAVQAVAASIRRARAGMQDIRRPIGSFLFLGPTGVGKTELAKSLANSLFDEEDALLRLDMSEYMERNAVSRLLGAPPGYVGYEEGGQLTEAIRKRPYAVLLLDEIEKAHPEVFNILLQVLDDGRLTDSQGRTVDFRNTVIVMTSNLASKAILNNSLQVQNENSNKNMLAQELDQQINEALSKYFRPEFLNRIDEVIRFKPLKPENLEQIVRLQLDELKKLLKQQGLALYVDDATIKTLAEEGYEPEYGARPLRRVIRRRLENPLATQILEEAFEGAKSIRVATKRDESNKLLFLIDN